MGNVITQIAHKLSTVSLEEASRADERNAKFVNVMALVTASVHAAHKTLDKSGFLEMTGDVWDEFMAARIEQIRNAAQNGAAKPNGFAMKEPTTEIRKTHKAKKTEAKEEPKKVFFKKTAGAVPKKKLKKKKLKSTEKRDPVVLVTNSRGPDRELLKKDADHARELGTTAVKKTPPIVEPTHAPEKRKKNMHPNLPVPTLLAGYNPKRKFRTDFEAPLAQELPPAPPTPSSEVKETVETVSPEKP